MWVLAALLLVLVALPVLILAIPVDLDARVEVHGTLSAHISLSWLFGRVKKTFHSGREGEKASPPGSAKKREGRKKKAGGKRPSRDTGRLVLRLLGSRGLVRSLGRLVVRLVRCIRVRKMALDFAADLGDPADTAMVLGAASQATMLVSLWTPCSFTLTPAFCGEPMVDGEAELAARVRPLCAVHAVLAFLCSPAALRAVVLVVRSRWR